MRQDTKIDVKAKTAMEEDKSEEHALGVVAKDLPTKMDDLEIASN
jgi:hypothetical protein